MLIGLGLGIATGLVFGELAAPLRVVADAFIRLLQMMVLPYLVVSLVGALGRLERGTALAVARAGAGALVALWAVALLLVVALPLVLPPWTSGAFFSSSLVEPPGSFDIVAQYIPANPFRSMADNVVPAVVLFSILLGVGVMTVPDRAPLLADLAVLERALVRANGLMVRLTPLGLFAIAASTIATAGVEHVGRVQLYLAAFVAFGVLLTFVVLPALAAAVTPVPAWTVIRAARDPLLTAFVTGSLFVVLPQIVDRVKALVAEAAATDEHAEHAVEILVPVSFTFPHAGKVLTLAFVPFAAWTAGVPFGPGEAATLVLAGVGATFGSMNVAVPYLLDLLAIPADTFQLFLAVGVATFRVATLVATMHTLVLALVATAVVTGRLTVRWRTVATHGAAAALSIVVCAGGLHLVFGRLESPTGAQARLLTERPLLFPTDAVVRRDPPVAAPGPGSALARARARGVLRVGYAPGALPLSYFNARGELVGLDVDMAHAFARDLRVGLELVPADRTRLAADLDAGAYDVAMTAVPITTDRAGRVGLSRPYLHFTLAFVVRDERRGDFGTRERVQALRGLRVAVVADGYYADKVRRYLPDADLVTVASLEDFFERQQRDDLDALVHAAEIASAWTLLRPEYTVVVPQPDRLRVPVGYAVGVREIELRELLDTWILLKEADRTIHRLRRYWVLGIDEEHPAPRWSVLRNVLGWVE